MTKELLKSVKSARFHYDEYLSKQEKKKQLEAIPADIVTIKNKKSALEKICDTLTKDFEKLMDKAEKKNDMALVSEPNSLKRKRSEKCQEISEMQSMLDTLEKKKRMQ